MLIPSVTEGEGEAEAETKEQPTTTAAKQLLIPQHDADHVM